MSGDWIPEPGSFLVAITRWGRDQHQELSYLASLLGVGAYDLRMRIMGQVPVVLAERLSHQSAQSLCDLLQTRGHGTVVCDKAEVKAGREMFLPRDFGFSPTVLTLTENQASAGSIIAYDQIVALVMATQAVEVLDEQQKTKKKFSASMAIATGGLVRKKKVTKQLRSNQSERESVLYMFCNAEPRHVFFQESRLHYKGLGQYMGLSRPENFSKLVKLLRQKAPGAMFDDSMFRHMRQRRFSSSAGVIKSSKTVHSNASENDLIAWLIVLGHLAMQT